MEQLAKSKLYNQTRRINNIYKIINYDKQIVPFVQNDAQKYVRYIQKLDYKKRGCNRLLILKARQVGITTDKCIEKTDEALFYENKDCKLSAHKESKAIEIFSIIKFAYDSCPQTINLEDGTVWTKPTTVYCTTSKMVFSNGSKIEVVMDTRSGTPSDVHSTELAFVQNAKEMMTGTIPSLSATANFTIETTANGVGGQFHEMWTNNYQNPKGTFTCIFIPWFIENRYRVKLDEGEEIVLPKELQHLKNYGLDDEQLKFYLLQYFNLGDKVFQEYPSNPDEAFLASGRLFYNTGIIKRLPILKYTKDEKYWQDTENELRWYIDPYSIDKDNPMEDLIFGVDTSEGLPDGDFASVKVRRRDLSLICSYKGRVKADELCDVIEHILDFGIAGVIGIEKNNTGILTLAEAKKRWWYYMLYKTTIVDEMTRKKTKKVGFSTNGQTRPLILGEHEKLVRQGLLTQIDERQKTEMYGFVYNEAGKPEAQQGSHDDDILSDAICCFMANEPQQITMDTGNEEEVVFTHSQI